ncbi:hypothetical protein HpDR60_13540 [Helicobacter pylori]
MQVIEQDLGKSYYQKLLNIRDLPIGDSVFFLILEAKKEIKNEMGQIFFINNGLEAPLDKASDFANLKLLSKKALFFNNTLFNNAFNNHVIKEGDLIKITKKANVGDVVQQKHGKKKINYFDYKITICNNCVMNEWRLFAWLSA